MKKETIYKCLIALLLTINIIHLINEFNHRGASKLSHDERPRSSHPPLQSMSHQNPRPSPHENSKNFRNKGPVLLGLDEAQTQRFFSLSQKHRENMLKLQKQQLALTSTYFQTASENLLTEIANIQKNKILSTDKHFTEVYELLAPEQQPKFDEFKNTALEVILR